MHVVSTGQGVCLFLFYLLPLEHQQGNNGWQDQKYGGDLHSVNNQAGGQCLPCNSGQADSRKIDVDDTECFYFRENGIEKHDAIWQQGNDYSIDTAPQKVCGEEHAQGGCHCLSGDDHRKHDHKAQKIILICRSGQTSIMTKTDVICQQIGYRYHNDSDKQQQCIHDTFAKENCVSAGSELHDILHRIISPFTGETDIGGENNAVPDDRCHHVQTGVHNICTFNRKWDPDDMDGIPDRYVDQNGNDHSDYEQGIWISPMTYFVTFAFEEIIQSLSLLTVQ